MPPSSLLVTAALLIPVPLYLLQQHLRLLRSYPTQPVPSALEISNRHDRPIVGMGISKEWLATHAGDCWSVVVPRKLLLGSKGSLRDGEDGEERDMLKRFTRAFWGSFPLRVERSLVELGIRMGTGFRMRGIEDPEKEREFEVGARVTGGLFAVDAHDVVARPPTLKSAKPMDDPDQFYGPIVTSWWLSSPLTPNALLGGYHSFSISPLPTAGSQEEPQVRLLFVAHLILAPLVTTDEVALREPSRISTKMLEKELNWRQRTMMKFHRLYARILLDCAVGRLQRGASDL